MKITKRQLQRIITESTKKALNELDWKTYANAAKEAQDDLLFNIWQGEDMKELGKKKEFQKRVRQRDAFRDQAKQATKFNGYDVLNEPDWLGLSNEINDYRRGNYEYKKGEGWQLKEPKLRKYF